MTAIPMSGLFPATSPSNAGVAVTLSTEISSLQPDDESGSEVIFNLCNHMHNVVASGSDTNVRTSSASSLSGSTLTKTYTFTFDLDFVASDVADLNVKTE